MKLIALYKQPEDTEAFDNAFFNEHMPLVHKIPGLEKTTVSRVKKTLSGEGFYLVSEMHFPDKDTFKAAMNSPEMVATGKDVKRFADGLLTLMITAEA